MSDLLNSASLVMIPSGYKEDVVYSQIPTDGSGDLSFTRASNGTRVNSAGLVEVAPWNMLQYSEDFSSADWNKQNLTITTNSTTAPNGATTADKAIPTTSNTSHGLENAGYLDLTIGQTYTASFYAKASGYNFIQFLADGGDISGNPRANFNLSNGTLGSVDTGLTASIESVGNSWYRCVVSFVVAYNVFNLGLYVSDSGTASRPPIFTGNGTDGVFIWGAQINIGSTAKPYFPTTDRLNVPRLTYQNGGGGCPSLLLEKQSTNLPLYSEQFDNAAWAKAANNATLVVTANYGISPDGTQNADRIQMTQTAGSGNYSQIYQIVTVTVGNTYTWSVWLKSLSGTPTVGWAYDGLNWSVITLTTEWQRYTITKTAQSTAINSDVLLYGALSTSLAADFLMWGFQLEASSYATSYIPTTSSSATRVADECRKTGISSLIGQTSGSVFFDFTVDTISGQTNGPVLWYMKDGGAGERYVELLANGNLEYVESNGSIIAYITKSGLTVGRHKCAIAYAPNDMTFYVDGVQIGTDTSGTPSGFSTFSFQYYISVYDGQQKVNQCVIFPTRLTNAELASLTTL